MLHSLRFRLLLVLVAVVGVALGTVALVSSTSTRDLFIRYVQFTDEAASVRDQRMADVIYFYTQEQDDSDVGQVAADMAQRLDQRVLIVDAQNRVIADSAGAAVGSDIGQLGMIDAVVIMAGEPPRVMMAGTRVPGPNEVSMALPVGAIPVTRPINTALDPIQQTFIRSVNQSLLLAVVLAGLAALLLTLFFSRRMLRPIEALTAAARHMERGDMAQRVHVTSRDEIGQLAHAFNAMADSLATQERLRRTMVTDVAHELRTPLTNIRGYLEAVRDGVVQPEPELIDSLYEETMLLNRLVGDLQELSLAEAGRLTLDRQLVEPAEFIQRTVRAFAARAAEKGVTLVVHAPAELPTVEIDTARMGQVLRNLLTNALTHTPAGGSVHVCASATGGQLIIEVRDTGHGIPAEDLPHIFERFYRSERSRSRANGGAGLGLTIARQLVAAHSGTIQVASEAGQGAKFTVSLPLAPALIEF